MMKLGQSAACLATVWLSMACLAACGSDDEAASTAAEGGGPLYVVHTRTFSPEGTQGLFTPTPSLDVAPDATTSLEEPGGGWIFAENEVGRFLIADGEEPTLTRYEIDARGALVPGTRLSFANYGV